MMDARIAFPTMIGLPRRRPAAAVGGATRQRRGARAVAAALALGTALLAATAGAILDGRGTGPAVDPGLRPLPGLGIVVMIAR